MKATSSNSLKAFKFNEDTTSSLYIDGILLFYCLKNLTFIYF